MEYLRDYSCRIFLLLLITMSFSTLHASDNMRFRGALVAEPCNIASSDENIKIDFGTTVDKYIYINDRSPGQSFTIHLIDCDISIGNLVSVTFNGIEDSELPGFVALSSSSIAAGVAIGIEDLKGNLIPVNRTGPQAEIIDGSNDINLKAFIKGVPSYLSNESIKLGTFNAFVTFTLQYE